MPFLNYRVRNFSSFVGVYTRDQMLLEAQMKPPTECYWKLNWIHRMNKRS